MKNTISEKLKERAAKAWLNDESASKAQIARKYKISTRTLGRAVEKLLSKTSFIDILADDSDTDVSNVPGVEPISFMATKSGVTMFKGAKSLHVHADNENYAEVVAAIMNQDLDGAWSCADIATAIEQFSEGNIKVVDGVVSVGGFVVNNKMADKLVQMTFQDRAGAKVFARFFSHLMNHADPRVIEELYGFLSHNDIKLNEDGSFNAFRAVTHDYLDKYSRKIDNSVGAEPEMPRSMVDADKNRTCSRGLHFASIAYARGMYYSPGDRIVEVTIWPEDVIAIPTDYSEQKGRCCKYKVIGDVTEKYM